nr:electron transfer flavoprotein-ubiquinone oxidoreductase [Vibrio natriegens]
MKFDVVIVGAGPAGLSAACRLLQLSSERAKPLSVCVVEKGSEVGAHTLAGTVFEPRALDELFPEWRNDNDVPVSIPVIKDDVLVLRSAEKALKIPSALVPKNMHNEDNYVVSLGNVCRWLSSKAESLGAEIYPGFAASEIIYHEDGQVKGVLIGDMGVDREGSPKDTYTPGMELHGTYTLLCEGSRGHLGKTIISKFDLDKGKDPQHYGLGIKELWSVDPEKVKPGLVVHTTGWPLNEHHASGGGFLYHLDNDQVYVGLITDLNYSNPYLSPFEEFQRLKLHPQISQYLEGGKRLAYGARAITKGGFNALPKMSFPGGLLLGCEAGTLVSSKIKGSHSAMKAGMLGAEAVFDAIDTGLEGKEITRFESIFKDSWLYEELFNDRNFVPALHKFGTWIGGAFAYVEQNILRRSLPWTFRDKTHDHANLSIAADVKPITYAKPDNVLTFDRLSSVFISNTNHEENQPCHLKLLDTELPISYNLKLYDEPAQRYCPAGVYELTESDGKQSLQINAQNCIHCKTCDIKDPAQNIIWTSPEGGGGPNYPNM